MTYACSAGIGLLSVSRCRSSQDSAFMACLPVIITRDFAVGIMSMPLDCKPWKGRDCVPFAYCVFHQVLNSVTLENIQKYPKNG